MPFSQCNGTHAASLVCWLCSDARPWWREARIKAGLSAEPPNLHPNAVYGPQRAGICSDCGVSITGRGATGRCQSCAQRHAWPLRDLRRKPLRERFATAVA